jgi:hypothetical protein
MVNLILKDILIQKKTSLYFIGFLAMWIIFSNTMGNLYIPLVLFCVSSNFIETALLKDESSQRMIASLPVRRSDIILAKYASIFVFIAVALLLYFAISFILEAAGIIKIENLTNSKVISIYIVQTLFFSSLYFPINFKFEYSKVRYFNIFLTLIIAFTPQFIEGYPYTKNIIPNIASYLAAAAPNLNTAWIVIFLLMILLLISFIVSCQVYKNREFN